MKQVTLVTLIMVVTTTDVAAQQQTFTVSRHHSHSYESKTAERLGYAQLGLTAFLALLDSSTGARQGGLPVPGYPSYPGPGPGGSWGAYGGVAVTPPLVVIDGVVICDDPSWCTWPSPLGPGPGADGFVAGYRAGAAWARERRIAGAVRYHTDYSAGLDAAAGPHGW